MRDAIYAQVRKMVAELQQLDDSQAARVLVEVTAIMAMQRRRHGYEQFLDYVHAGSKAAVLMLRDPTPLTQQEQNEAMQMHVDSLPTRKTAKKGKSPWSL